MEIRPQNGTRSTEGKRRVITLVRDQATPSEGTGKTEGVGRRFWSQGSETKLPSFQRPNLCRYCHCHPACVCNPLAPASKPAKYHLSDPSSMVMSPSGHSQETFPSFKDPCG